MEPCDVCDGSGEGLYSDTVCSYCHGTGIEGNNKPEKEYEND